MCQIQNFLELCPGPCWRRLQCPQLPPDSLAYGDGLAIPPQELLPHSGPFGPPASRTQPAENLAHVVLVTGHFSCSSLHIQYKCDQYTIVQYTVQYCGTVQYGQLPRHHDRQ